MPDVQPFLLDPSNAWLLAPPPRRVPPNKLIVGAVEALFFPGFIMLGGAIAIFGMALQGAGEVKTSQIVCPLLLVPLTVALAALSLSLHSKRYRREMTLLRSGRAILGEVVSCTVNIESGPSTEGGHWTQETVTLEYAVTTPAGVLQTGTIVRISEEVRKGAAPRAGEAMAVLYLDDEKFLVL